MTMMTDEEVERRIASARRLGDELKDDPELLKEYLNAANNSLPRKEKLRTPKERYQRWVKETLAELAE